MTLPEPRILSGLPPDEVPLDSAPLIRVISQIKFSPILAIRNPDKVAIFQEAIRTHYPILSQERVNQVVFSPVSLPGVQEGLIWRFLDNEKAPIWRVSLGTDFIALETSAYKNRSDFVSRLGLVLKSLEDAFAPADVQRLGLRYIDRLTDEAQQRLGSLIKPEVLGLLTATDQQTNQLGGAITYLISEAQMLAEEGLVQARWGCLPANVTFDPAALEPVNNPSWVLDIDMFSAESQPFSSEQLVALVTKFAERIYSVFRAMVTEEFLTYYGKQDGSASA